MDKELKNFQTRYKNCTKYNMKDVKTFSGVSDHFYYYLHDLKGCLVVLEELVLEAKCNEEMAKLTKIEDFAKKNGKIKDILKETQNYQKNVLSGYRNLGLTKLPKPAAITGDIKTLKKLKDDIEDDLKKRDKKDKSRSEVSKLSKQIDEDLKAGDEYLKSINKIPKEYLHADTVYDDAVKAILKAKPKMSADTKKFNKLLKNELEKKKLKDKVNSFEKWQKKISDAGDAAILAAEDKKKDKMNANLQTGAKTLKKLQEDAKKYAKFKKNVKANKDKISTPQDKKRIDNALKKIGEILEETNAFWDGVADDIARISKG